MNKSGRAPIKVAQRKSFMRGQLTRSAKLAKNAERVHVFAPEMIRCRGICGDTIAKKVSVNGMCKKCHSLQP